MIDVKLLLKEVYGFDGVASTYWTDFLLNAGRMSSSLSMEIPNQPGQSCWLSSRSSLKLIPYFVINCSFQTLKTQDWGPWSTKGKAVNGGILCLVHIEVHLLDNVDEFKGSCMTVSYTMIIEVDICCMCWIDLYFEMLSTFPAGEKLFLVIFGLVY